MSEPVIHCSACGRLLQYKWFGIEIYVDEDATIKIPGEQKLPKYQAGSYGICRICFLKAMGVPADGKPADVRKMQEVPARQEKPVRTRRTPVTKADIDRYRRSTRTDRGKKRKAADRRDRDIVQDYPIVDRRKSPPVRPVEYGELPSNKGRKERKADAADDKKMP